MSTHLFLLLVFSLGVCLGAILVINLRPSPQTSERANLQQTRTGFLFEGDELIDATPIGHQLLSGLGAFNSAKSNLIALCKQQYPDLENAWSNLTDLGSCILTDVTTSTCNLELSKAGDRVSVKILDGPDIRGQTIQEDLFAARIKFLGDIVDQSPELIWKESEKGDLLWSNRRYREFLVRNGTLNAVNDPRLVQERLFKDLEAPDGDAKIANESLHAVENAEDKKENWFNVISFPTTEGSLHYAADVNETISAKASLKSSLRTFVQIFAQLSIGFAIFDENRQLVIYNPSIVDLTGLDPIFLSSKPTLLRVVEEMRRTDRAPEPKNFRDFRETIRQLEQAATKGTYEAVWTLADGQSLRVTGRPYQSGSLALLVEDVSSELALTRRYRTEIQAHQEVLDLRDEPLCVFSQSNVLVSCNTSAQKFFESGENEPASLEEFVRFLNKATLPSPPLSISQLDDFQQLHLQFIDGRSFEMIRHVLSGGFFCLELRARDLSSGLIPRVVERANGKGVQ